MQHPDVVITVRQVVADDQGGLEHLFQRDGSPFRTRGDDHDVDLERLEQLPDFGGDRSGADQRHGFAVDAGADAGLAALPVAGAVDFAAVSEVSLE